ncbi:pyridoxal phosphate-dependent transferase [Scleroderma citrinum]
MSHLYRHLRIHQVFGANTDVGKTIITTALARASALKNNTVFYLKPVSTGPLRDADDEHIKRFAGPKRSLIETRCLFRYDDPVSPHLAVKLASGTSEHEPSPPSDATFPMAVAEYVRACARKCQAGHMYIETAGGVHSPTLSGTTQIDSYRPLLLPSILIGDSKLGGISSTISSYESLLLRGYTVDAVILFRDSYYRNYEYLTSYFAERSLRVLSLDPPPRRLDNHADNLASTESYYSKVVPGGLDSEVFEAVQHLEECHVRRIEELDSMPRRALDTIWWPFVQHGHLKSEKDVTIIDSASGDFFSVYNRISGSSSPTTSLSEDSLLAPQFDSSASWWTQAVGHAQPSLTLAAAMAAGRYGHVIFPQAIHLPALKLAERLISNGPGKGWASRAFFSDNGSTGTEVALKMALRCFSVNCGNELTATERKNLGIIGLKGSYHGDTIGAMDATEEGVYTCEWHQSKGLWFDPPTVAIRHGKLAVSIPTAISNSLPSVHFQDLGSIYNVNSRLASSLAETYRLHIKNVLQAFHQSYDRRLAALMLEPIVMGAGGMIFVDPLFQRILVDTVRDRSLFSNPLPVIYDEVFTGLYRLGVESSIPLLGSNPDIAVYAKMLTGGTLPLAVTLASDHVFQAFNSQSKADALLHGHSYTAHAIGCQVANESLDSFDSLVKQQSWRAAQDKWISQSDSKLGTWSFWDPSFVQAISQLDIVQEVMTLGTILTVKFSGDNTGYVSHSAKELLQPINAPEGDMFGIHFRTLGNVAYFMTSLNTPRKNVEVVENRIWMALAQYINSPL